MEKSLPVFLLSIDDAPGSDLEVNYVALVDKPAIERNFLAFGEVKPLTFAVNEDQRIISGPAMLADYPIYRQDAEHGEYYVMFNAASIQSIVKKFFAKGFNQNFNLSHDPNQRTEGVYIFQSFITNQSLGISPMKGYEDAKDGSWFISAKVDNEEVWQKVKTGEIKGFSVEGMFKYTKQAMSKEETMFHEIKAVISKLYKSIK